MSYKVSIHITTAHKPPDKIIDVQNKERVAELLIEYEGAYRIIIYDNNNKVYLTRSEFTDLAIKLKRGDK